MLDKAGFKSQQNRVFEPVSFHNVSLAMNGQGLIRDISCKLDRAGVSVVMGANGAGKSLFLRLLARLLEPDSGHVKGGFGAGGKGDASCLSIVFQKPVLLRRSTFANIAYVLKQKGLPKHLVSEKVLAALKQARIEQRSATPARRLSGGEQQRLALARALVVEPSLLLLDEATASLDPASTFIVENMVAQAAQSGTKVVFVTHDVKQAKRVGDDVLFMHGGEILAHKPSEEFFQDPGSAQAQAYLDGRIEA